MLKIKTSILIPVAQLVPNEWNPNVESDETFNELVKEIEEDGFEQPINVVPFPEYSLPEVEVKAVEYEEGKSSCYFKIIGGEHRWKAAKVLGYVEVPCYVHSDWDEMKQKLKTVRRNLLVGDLNDVKFTELVNSLTDEFEFDSVELARAMGFDTEADFAKHYIEERDAKEKSFIDGLLDETQKAKFAVDSLSDIIATIFADAGDMIDQNFLHFTFKGSLQTVILCDEPTLASVKQMAEFLRASGGMATDFIREAILEHLNVIKDEEKVKS